MEKNTLRYLLAFLIIITSCNDNSFIISEESLSLSNQEWNTNTQTPYLINVSKGACNYYLNYCDKFFQVSKNLKESKLLPDCHGCMRENDEMIERNNSLFISSDIDDGQTYLNEYYDTESGKWVVDRTFDRTEIVRHFETQFEDENYIIYFANREEGIGYLIFKAKKTGIEYAFKVYQLVKILFFKDSYYLVGRKSIESVSDPTIGFLHNGELYSSLHVQMPTNQKTLYIAPDDVCIYSGLVTDNNLFVLANDAKETYIAKFDDNCLIKDKSLDRLLWFSNYSRFNLGYSSCYDECILPYYDEHEQEWGVLDIVKKQIRLIKIKRND